MMGARKKCIGTRGSIGESKGSTAALFQGSGVLEGEVRSKGKSKRGHGRAWAQYVGSGGECGLSGWVLGRMARDGGRVQRVGCNSSHVDQGEPKEMA
jgi:hypothetical protein